MRRRTAAVIAGGALAVMLVGGVVWFWSSARETTSLGTSPGASPVASTGTPDIRALAQESLERHLTACTKDETDGETVPEGCGIRIPWGTEFARADSIRFRVEQMPELVLTDDGFRADDGILVATITGAGHDGVSRSETYRTTSWSVRGDVELSGSDVALTVW